MKLFPRMELDYNASDLWRLLFARGDEDAELKIIGGRMTGGLPFALSLSVRTAFHLLLSAMEKGSRDEIVMSGLTVPAMAEIARLHGYRVRVADIDLSTLATNAGSLKELVCERTKLVVIAPLFGAINDLEPLARICRDHGALLIEDAAQAWDGSYCGSPEADVVFLSFGPAKTATCLGGAIVLFRQAGLQRRFAELNARLAVKPAHWRIGRVLRFWVMMAFRPPAMLGLLASTLQLIGVDPDRFIGSQARGFPQANLIGRIGFRLPGAFRHLMAVKLADYPGTGEREARARAFIALLDASVPVPGREADRCSFWLTAVCAANPAALVARLRRAGFDASQTASSLTAVIDDETGEPAWQAGAMATSLIYLPLSRHLSTQAMEQMARIINNHAAQGGTPGTQRGRRA